jgi:DNA-binding NarL/FixJ family response regulator
LAALERAYALLVDCDATRHRDRVARELRRLGRSTSRPGGRTAAPSGIGALSPREQEVSALVAQGLTNRRIAEELFVSVKTVEEHVAHAFAKLDVRSRAALAVAFESGSSASEPPV